MADSGQLEKFGMTDLEVFHALDRLNVRDVDYADLYFESRVSESVSMEEGIVKRASKSISQGVGVRATAGEKTGFAYSDELTKKDLEIAADTARYIANSPKGDRSLPVPTNDGRRGISIPSNGRRPRWRRRTEWRCSMRSMPRPGAMIRGSKMYWLPLIRNIKWSPWRHPMAP